MKSRYINLAVFIQFLVVLVMVGCGTHTHWPIVNINTEHPVANSSSEYQRYGGNPYIHEGIDIIETPYPTGPSLRTVCDSTVQISQSANPIYHGIILTQNDGSDDDGSEYWYWHVDWNSIPQAVINASNNGTVIADNTVLGQIVDWPSCSFDHVHFERHNPAGTVYNAAMYCEPHNDNTNPEVLNIYFCENGTNNYFGGNPIVVDGDVDIVAEIRDRMFTNNWNANGHSYNTGVYTINYQIDEVAGSHDVENLFAWFLTIPASNTASIIFKTSGTYTSSSDYCGTERYYYVVTNHKDGIFDENGYWDTDGGNFPNGLYNITVNAFDVSNNQGSRTVQVQVNN